MKVLTAAEMREVDRLTSERHGVPSLQLMETAGRHVAESCREIVHGTERHPRKISVLCGKGNNGGDGLVVARHLQVAQAVVKVLLFAKPEELHGDAAINLQRWCEAGNDAIPILDETAWKAAWPEVAGADVIVDAIFGTGFRGAVSGVIAKAIDDINQLSRRATSAHPSLILAVDTPSGLPSDGQAAEGPVLFAHRTVTFTAPKPGQLISKDAVAAGTLEVVGIGSPAALVEEIGKGSLRWIEPTEFANFPFVRSVDSNKGLYGHVLVVAGSLGKSGAAVMAGYTALRGGAGLVTVATPDLVLPVVASAHPEVMTEPLAATAAGSVSSQNLTKDRFSQVEQGKTVLALGPGLGLHAETQDFIRRVIAQTELPVVLDADGLNAFAGNADTLRQRRAKFLAITPHPGEMARLLMSSTKEVQEDRVRAAQEAAKKWNVHVVLKGSHTLIASPQGELFVNTSGNPGLAKGGSGDILTGLLAALTAQFKTNDWTRTLALGVYLHGKAAELATAATDESGLLATDVAAAIPAARRQLLQELQRRD
jgi:ADP-dependent NAD(P)H-hydrate dehydratase / NAD(P)H-hydrate epimerase